RCIMTTHLRSSPPFFFNPAAPPAIYTLSLHDALPIFLPRPAGHEARLLAEDGPGIGQGRRVVGDVRALPLGEVGPGAHRTGRGRDRKSTRLNSSHVKISYAVFCLKKKNKNRTREPSKR